MDRISHSLIESQRFGKNIYRGSCDAVDVEFISEYLRKNAPEILILRFPVAEQPSLYKLQNLAKTVIFADTLVYYELRNEAKNLADLSNDLRFSEATSDDLELLQNLIPVIFQGYSNHYFSNPLLEKDKIVEGYTEWAMNYVNAPQKVNLIVHKDNVPAGFITCSYENDEAEIILNGVVPEFRRGGIYTDMVRFVKRYFFEKGIKIIKVSTQIQNFAVQNVWRKEHFYLKEAFITIHLNSE